MRPRYPGGPYAALKKIFGLSTEDRHKFRLNFPDMLEKRFVELNPLQYCVVGPSSMAIFFALMLYLWHVGIFVRASEWVTNMFEHIF